MTNRFLNILAFSILTLLWAAFGAALVFKPEVLDSTWQLIRSWPLLVQGAVWLLALPVMLGLWIWQTSWPFLLRLALVGGLAWVTVYTFLPRQVSNQPEAAVKQDTA